MQQTRRRFKPFISSLWISLVFLLSSHGFMLPQHQHDSYASSFNARRTHSSASPLYGIKGFRAWFETQFPDSIVNVDGKHSQEHFDHVLLDMNQILHVVLRRSRNEDHSVRLLMSELDRIFQVVTPTQSIVLAIDGPPAAAKLATQRRRRYGTLVRTEWKLAHFDKLRIPKRQRPKKLRIFKSDLQTLQITPATEFMERMESTLLYWAWQRLQQRYSKLKHVKIYINPSTVPGEGEVKLLEWILQKPRLGQSLAILGRDSDLLLEGLVIPPTWTHNVFVIRQEGINEYHSVSLWETTRALQGWLPPESPPNHILQLRTDLVILMILNGNDYLPKLRGSKGFSNICQHYRKMLKEYPTGGLVNPDTLEFNLDFSIAFFQLIADSSPPELWTATDLSQSDRKTPLGELNNLMEGSFVPRPKRFRVIKKGVGNEKDGEVEITQEEELNDDGDGFSMTSNGDEEIDDKNGLSITTYGHEETDVSDKEAGIEETEKEDENESTDQVLIQLTLGDPESSDDCLRYELWQDKNDNFKEAKQKLASMALDDFLGTNYSDSDTFDFKLGITNSGYSWEILHAVEGKADRYLGGLLWNLQTYQDGICADYNYNYGRCMSPFASDIVDFFKEAKAENRTVGCRELSGGAFGKPVSAGLTCLAALPSQVKHWIPSPYNSLPDETVENFYEQCMDPTDNVFDMKRFESLVEEEIAKLRKESGEPDEIEEEPPQHGRRIIQGDHYWTVFSRSTEPLTHPFDPPAPPTDELGELFANNRIRASRMIATDAPRTRSVWGDRKSKKRKHHGKENDDISHSSLGSFLPKGKDPSILDVGYKVAYRKERDAFAKKKRKNNKPTSTVKFESIKVEVKVPDEDIPLSVDSRMTEFNMTMPPKEALVNLDGQTAMVALSQLSDIGLVGKVKFNMRTPSGSKYASFDPSKYEHLQLTVESNPQSRSCVLDRKLIYEQDRDVIHQSRQALKQHLASIALCDITGSGYQWSKLNLADLRKVLMDKMGANSPQEASAPSNNKTKVDGDNNSISAVDVYARMKKFQKSQPGKEPIVNKDGQTAVACLQQLTDSGLIGETKVWMTRPSESKYASYNPTNYEQIHLLVRKTVQHGGTKDDENSKSGVLDQDLEYDQDRDVNAQSRRSLKQHLATLALCDITGPTRRWSEMTCAQLKAFLIANPENSRVMPPFD